MPTRPGSLRLLNGGAPPRPALALAAARRAGRMIPHWLRPILAEALREHEREIEQYKEALEGHEETRDRLRILQHVLILLLGQQVGSVVLYAGELNLVPPGSTVGVLKLAPGEGDRVPLRIYWRPPGQAPTTDLRPAGA